MDPLLFGRALVLGFTIAAAVGPIGLLTIRRTLAHGPAYGLASGLGVALADGTYAAIAAFGLTALTLVLVGGRVALGLVGGAFLVWLGIRTLWSRPRDAAETTAVRPGLAGAFASIYGLTMTNPMTILSFAGLFAALSVTASGGVAAAIVTVGVFAGSMAWWLVLTTIVGRLRGRVTLEALTWVNRVSGAVVALFGVAAMGAALAPR